MRMFRLLFSVLIFFATVSANAVTSAAPPLTLGFVATPKGLVRDAAQAEALASQLAMRLASPVQVRLLADEVELRQWLTFFREVDCAWLSEAFLARLPAGEVLPLATTVGSASPQSGFFVVRQGLDASILQQLLIAMLSLEDALPRDEVSAAFGGVRVVAISEEDFLVRMGKVKAGGPMPAPPTQMTATDAVDVTKASEPEPPVTLAADRLDYDWENRVFRADGSAVLQQGETTLAADELLWQEATQDAVASGNIRLTEATGEMQGNSIRSNLATRTGRVTDGRVLLKEHNFHLAGAEIERLGEATYRVTDGRFTTCDGDNPDWQFTAAEIDVNLGRFAVAHDVWFEAGGQPLLYLPYLLFPVRSERESGFLLPRVGYSSRKGAILSLAWYEVIDRHLDATVYLDILSELGVGKGLEYRYALGGNNQGKALLYHVSGIDNAPDSYAIDWQHDGMLPGEVRLAADIEYVDKKEFFENFGESADQYNRNQAVSTLLLQRHWEKLNLTGHARYIRDLERDNAATLQRLPELGLGLPFYRVASLPLYTQTEARATNFRRSEGEDGTRFFLRQGLNLVFKPGDWLEVTPGVAVYGRYYKTGEGEDGDLLPEYSVALSTRLLRVFPFEHWGMEKLQHSIEPQVSYTYIPNRDQVDLPMFDLKDRIGPMNMVEYALINRVTARSTAADGTAAYREVLNLRLSQAYDIREERDDSVVDPEPFSDLRTELTVLPTPQSIIRVDALTRVHGDLSFSRFSAGAGYDDSHGDQARIDYYYRDTDLPGEATDYLRAELATSRFAPVYLTLGERYDFQRGKSFESMVGLEYRAKCWSLFLTFRDRPDDQAIMIGFALSGLGSVGGFDSMLRPLEN